MNRSIGRRMIWAFYALTFGTILTCAGQDPERLQDRSADAERVVDTYLAQSAVRSSSQADGVLFSCEDIGASSNVLALAQHRLLGSSVTGDTALVKAEVTTVARVRLALDDYYEVVPTVAIDTLSWWLHRRADERWGICGYAVEGGVDFVRIGHLGSRVRWLNGSSIESLQRRADSVAAIRNDGS